MKERLRTLREVNRKDAFGGEIPILDSWKSRKPVGVVTDRDIV
jgi:hypothetical protein